MAGFGFRGMPAARSAIRLLTFPRGYNTLYINNNEEENKMKFIRFSLTVILAMAMCLSAAFAETTADAPAEGIDYLTRELEASAAQLLAEGEDVNDIYSELNWVSIADTFPAKFDLRERGTVTPVKDQSPWGTCWSFATAAASETSILNNLGMTTESYKEAYGEELDLSEKHLAWFTAKALPEISEYPEGEYPYNPGQAGEGIHPAEGSDQEPLNGGGNYFLSMTSLATGIGILKEKYAPYSDSKGELDKSGDWSLPEEQRYGVSYELKDANILPAPASHDEDGNYVYRAAATEAIKAELLSGRAVGISFKADKSRPQQTKEEIKASLEEHLADQTDIPTEEKAYYIDVRAGYIDTADLSDEELKNLILFRLRINSIPEDTYDLGSFDHDQLARILMSSYFSMPYEQIVSNEDKAPYMSFIGSEPVIYAQYTYEAVQSNHAVTVVGWDDTFSAENWPEDRRPPADGAWIVRNSWGTDWGNDGYFLLSYYDKTLCGLGTFEYVVDDTSRRMDFLSILAYDHMPAEIISSTLFSAPVYAANVFAVDTDSVLQYVSALTGDLDTTVTASIYLLNKDASLPTDGILLDSITETFRYAGYHRLELNSNLLLPKESRISVVVMESVPVTAGNKYALVNTSSLNKNGMEAYNKLNESKGNKLQRYCVGIVNPGESFISLGNGEWTDWSEAVAKIGSVGANVNMAYDNLPVKAYVYPLTEVEKIHDLSRKIPTIGGEAAICPEDGYLLLDIIGNE